VEIRNILTIILMSAGFLCFAASTIGVFRMKDFYCRSHAAGICGSAGLIFSAVGLFIYEGVNITGIKILLVLMAVCFSSPIGTHIICKVAYKQSLEAEADAAAQKTLGNKEEH
jgi:multicomponent Na+:H+ antiporter subunit G